MRDLLRSPLVRLVAVLLAIVLLFRVAFLLRGVLTPFAVGLALAYFLNPAANALERFFRRDIERSALLRGRVEPRAAAVAVLALVVVVVIALVLVILLPALYHQVADAAAKLPDYVRTLKARVQPVVERLNLRYPEQVEEVKRRAVEAVRNNLSHILSPIGRGIELAFSSLLDFVLTLLNLLIVPVFTIYLLYDMNRIREGTRELVPWRYRAYLYSRVEDVDRLLSAFARGQVTVCLILGTFYAIGLTACGVPMGILAGYFIGFLNLIPYMSFAIGLPLALVLSFVDDQSLGALAAVAAIFAFGQIVEGNVITPRIVGRSLGLHEVVIMLAVLVGGTLFGLAGMLLAVPVTAALSVFWQDLRVWYLQSEFYGRDAPVPVAVTATPPAAPAAPPAPPAA
jgi:predicted PurR-regulated permease PerM